MVDVSDWYVRLSEPVRVCPVIVPRHLGFYVPNFTFFGFDRDLRMAWFRPLTEPVRAKRPLPNRDPPYLFLVVPHISYRFNNLTELGDTGTFTFTTYPAKDLAKVTITEVKAEETPVIINEIRYDRGYS